MVSGDTQYTAVLGFNYEPGDTRVEPGDPVPDDVAKADLTLLLDAGAIALPDAPKPLDTYTRIELDALAVEVGVEEPEGLPNKAAVIDAIEEATDDGR